MRNRTHERMKTQLLGHLQAKYSLMLKENVVHEDHDEGGVTTEECLDHLFVADVSVEAADED